MKNITAAFICIILTACIDSSSKVSNLENQTSLNHSQSVYYSNLMQSFSVRSQMAFTQSPAWLNQSFTSVDYIDLSTVAGIDAALAAELNSAYCVDDMYKPFNVKLMTWFGSVDEDGHYISPAIGASGTAIFSELTKTIPASNLGIYSPNNAIKFVNGSDYEPLYENCAGLSDVIPNGAPVILTDIPVPQLSKEIVTKAEYRTMTCDSGQVGHKIQIVNLEILPNGKYLFGNQELTEIPEGAWNLHADYCKTEIASISFESQTATVVGTNLASMSISTDNSVYRNINSNLSQIDCIRTSSYEEEEESSDADNADDYGRDGQHDDEVLRDSFDNCASEVEIEDANSAYEEYDRFSHLESHTTSCSGTPGSYTDSHLGYDATINHTAWVGSAEYEREIHQHKLKHNVSATALDGDRANRGSWYGVNIMCQRDEDLNIACNTYRPANAGYSLTQSSGYNYERHNSINGWADPANVVPNDPADPTWVFNATTSGCVWVDTRTISTGCPANHTGDSGYTEERRFAAATLGSGSWSAWNTISTYDNCQEESDDDDDSPCDCDHDGVDERSDSDDHDPDVQ